MLAGGEGRGQREERGTAIDRKGRDFCMRSAPYTGPEPTLDYLQLNYGWVWAYCGLPCGHDAAIPLNPIITRLGGNAPAVALRSRLRCTVCGRRSATLRAPSIIDHAFARMPTSKIPAPLRIAQWAPHARGAGDMLNWEVVEQR
jgi:hypothetical protein